MAETESDAGCFQVYRRLDGSMERVSLGRRNGRLLALLPPSCTEPPDKEQPKEIFEQSRLYVNLNPLEAETWKKLLKGQSIRDIAREEGVSRQAVYSRIVGNSKGQGGMVSKNFWVLLWWLLRGRINGHEKHD
jgi:DNA invertase Pin-like site-specific DNA recombinase